MVIRAHIAARVHWIFFFQFWVKSHVLNLDISLFFSHCSSDSNEVEGWAFISSHALVKGLFSYNWLVKCKNVISLFSVMQVLSEPKSFLSGFFNMFQPSTEELNYYLLWTFGHTNCFQQTVWSVVRVGHMGIAVSWRWVTLLLDILWGGLSPEQKPLCCAEPHLCGVVVVYFPWREGQSSPPHQLNHSGFVLSFSMNPFLSRRVVDFERFWSVCQFPGCSACCLPKVNGTVQK